MITDGFHFDVLQIELIVGSGLLGFIVGALLQMWSQEKTNKQVRLDHDTAINRLIDEINSEKIAHLLLNEQLVAKMKHIESLNEVETQLRVEVASLKSSLNESHEAFAMDPKTVRNSDHNVCD